MKTEAASLEQYVLNIMPAVRNAPSHLQFQVLKIAIAYYFRRTDFQLALDACVDLLSTLEKDLQAGHGYQNDKSSKDFRDLFEYLADTLEIEELYVSSDKVLNLLQNKLIAITARLKKISSLKSAETAKLMQILNNLEHTNENRKSAMEWAAKLMFDRLLESMNPDSVSKIFDALSFESDIEQKAAILDSMQEKFDQLVAYNDNGLLVRDFQVSYKKHLRAQINTKNNEID